MDRLNWITVRAYGPSVVALLFAGFSLVILSRLPESPVTQEPVYVLRWIPPFALVAATVLFVVPTYRLLQWQKGVGLSCPTCGGPLGRERDGRASRGGAFRQCYACRKNVNHRQYEKRCGRN